MKKQHKTLLEIVGGCVLALSSIYAINRIVFFLSTLKERLHTKDGHFYKHKTGKIYFTKTGTGSPLLLIHDLDSCSSAYEWNEVVETFSENHTVYTLDLPGCGRSDKPRITYTSYLYVQVISDFIRDIIGDTPDVIATKDSTPILVMTERMYPHLFSHMIFVNPGDFDHYSEYPGKLDTYRKSLYELPIIGTCIYNLSHSRATLRKRFYFDYFFERPAGIMKYFSRYYEAAHLKGSSCKYLYASKKFHYLDCNVIPAFSSISTPICVIYGDAVNHVTELADEMVSLNPITEFVILNDTKYLPQLEKPSQFVDTCEKFFAKEHI